MTSTTNQRESELRKMCEFQLAWHYNKQYVLIRMLSSFSWIHLCFVFIFEKVARKQKSTKKRQRVQTLISPPNLSTYAISWIKIRGYKDWPGVIEGCNSKGQYEIHFFGDYSRGTATKSKITNFFEGFSLFNDTFDDTKLSKAIKEACLCLSRNPHPTSCVVCDMLNFKRNLKTKKTLSN